MLAISVDLLLGTLRADPTGLAATGGQSTGEWPPTPLRLLAALVAGDGTRDRSRHTTGEELAFLEACEPPVIYASPPREVHHQILHPRYVVEQTTKPMPQSHQEYPARKGAQIRPGVRVAPRTPRVVFAWDVDVPAPVLGGLRARAARVGYLGAADSPVHVQVHEDLPDDACDSCYSPDPDGTILLGTPRPGVVRAMDAHFDRWTEDGPSVTRAQAPGLRRVASYRSPDDPVDDDVAPRPTMLTCVFDGPIPGRRVSAVTAAFKAAVLDHYHRSGPEPPPVLHGHVGGDGPYQLAHYLALPDAGTDRARGLIRGVALLLPAETDATVVERCRAALHALRELHGVGFDRPIRPRTADDRHLAVDPSRWRRPSRVWTTVFPAVHERRRTPTDLAEIARWCVHAGLPEPEAVRSHRRPLLTGGVDLSPQEAARPGRAPQPYSHVQLVFPEKVAGPVIIGAGRTRGLGLCLPTESGS